MILRMSNQTECQTWLPCAIEEIVGARFRANSHTALRGISCKSERGVLVLEGRLASFYHTQLAQEIAANIDGVVQVVNHIEVVSSDQIRLGDNQSSVDGSTILDGRVGRSCSRHRRSRHQTLFAAEFWSPNSHADQLGNRRQFLDLWAVHLNETATHRLGY